MRKKSQVKGSNAATLVLIILLILIFYILFLPQDEREELLGDGEYYSDSGSSDASHRSDSDRPSGALLYKTDISLTPTTGQGDKDIPDVYLFEIINAKEIARFNPLVVRNGWFDKEIKNLTFTIDDIDKTENVLLSFNLDKAKGTLKILVNGFTIYEYPAKKGNIEPIKIDKKYLQEINSIEFRVSGVGAKFWRTNEYVINEAKITADITDVSRQKSKNIFHISETEYEDLQSAILHFSPICDPKDIKVLEIEINNRDVYSATPNCNRDNTVTIPVGLLDEGENYVAFKTYKGTYNIKQIYVATEYLGMRRLRYNFYVDDDDYDDIRDEDEEVRMKIRFSSNNQKKATFDINDEGDDFNVDSGDDTFEYYIDEDWIEEGSNTLLITPKTNFDIEYITIELV